MRALPSLLLASSIDCSGAPASRPADPPASASDPGAPPASGPFDGTLPTGTTRLRIRNASTEPGMATVAGSRAEISGLGAAPTIDAAPSGVLPSS